MNQLLNSVEFSFSFLLQISMIISIFVYWFCDTAAAPDVSFEILRGKLRMTTSNYLRTRRENKSLRNNQRAARTENTKSDNDVSMTKGEFENLFLEGLSAPLGSFLNIATWNVLNWNSPEFNKSKEYKLALGYLRRACWSSRKAWSENCVLPKNTTLRLSQVTRANR